MKKLGLLMLLMVSVSAYGQGFSDGFESGNMNNWSPVYGTNMLVQDNVTLADNTTILPHSGTKLAYQARNYNSYWQMVRHNLTSAANGTLTFWVNPISFGGDFIFSVTGYGNHGETLRLMNSGTNIRIYIVPLTGPSINYYPGIAITAQQWHEVKFVIKDNTTTGSQVYWDGILIQDNITAICDLATIEFGTGWGSASVAYDDISFVPQGITVVDVTGQLNLEGFSGDKQDVSVSVEARSDTTQVLYPDLDASGNFTLSGLPVGNYTFAFKSYAHLQKNVAKTIAVGNASLGTIILKSGDTTGDNTVNGSDLNILLANLDAVGGL